MYSIESRVRYSEVNSEKQLTLSAILDYLQDCCTFQSEDMNVGVDYLAREQAAWVLSSWQIEVLRYPKMAEKIKISTWPYDFKGFYGKRNFLITDEAGEALVKANSLWVFMDIVRMRPVRIKDEVIEAYKSVMEPPLLGNWGERKIFVPEGGKKREPVRVARFQIDTNHHMNNGKYIQLAEEFLPENFTVGGLRAEYKKAAVLGDMLYPAVTIEENQAWVALKDAEDTTYAVIQFFTNRLGKGEVN